MSRRVPNPTGKGGFVKGQSGNPGGRKRKVIGDLGPVAGSPCGPRPYRKIADLSAEARNYASLALDTLVEIVEKGNSRDRLTAAKEILDRGFGRPIQAVDMIMIGKKLSELSLAELTALNSRLISSGAVIDAEPQAEEAVH